MSPSSTPLTFSGKVPSAQKALGSIANSELPDYDADLEAKGYRSFAQGFGYRHRKRPRPGRGEPRHIDDYDDVGRC